jgi:hypothetical protein
MGQKYAAYDSTGAIIAYYDSEISPIPKGVTAIEITDAQRQTRIDNPGHTVVGDELVAPTAPTAAQLLAAAQVSQTAAIDAAYVTAIQQSVSLKRRAESPRRFMPTLPARPY